MKMIQYISDLLYRYECVIVPDFGAFLTRTKSAVVDTQSNLFLAPRKQISFNEQLQQNDGLLVNHIASVNSIPYTEAMNQLQQEVIELKGKLISGEVITLAKIGHFSISVEGKLQFIPIEEVNYLTSSFGLDTTLKQPVLREVYKEEVEVIEEKAPIAFIPETRKKRPYLKYAAVTVLGLGMLGFLAKQGFDFKLQEVANHNAKQNIEAARISVQEASIFDLGTIPEVVLEVKAVKPITGPYHIIAGAYRFEENADKKIVQLKEYGYSARKIGQNKYGLHQVVYGSYANKTEALKNLRIVKNDHNKAAWLLVKKID
ncbi:HU domain-containing protein [Pseudofulvibacter geojedonensis]|uniref:SPOR domain-containing protein n=1 Tax=Pseudofulvibacter geojedonensis TaxID=1123758 RepID=A0ABW3I0V9_9FLAO